MVRTPRRWRELAPEGKEHSMHPACHILIADDVPMIVELLTELLTDEGYAVSTLQNSAKSPRCRIVPTPCSRPRVKCRR
jgi:hypothetical protein